MLLSTVSCNKFLDTMPDNRTELDTEEKIISILISAYHDHDYQLCTELMSDNIDDLGGEVNTRFTTFFEQLYRWADVSESNNESPTNFWSAAYGAIACANEALAAIEKIEAEGPLSAALQAAKGEALVARAYEHFLLVNIFCQHYDPRYPDDLGIPYMKEAETTLNPQYERGTVMEVYENIEKDLEAGLPLISDINYTVPRYHFNQKAAYAFATKFYLFYEKFDKAIAAANTCLGSTPQNILRNYAELAELPMSNGSQLAVVARQYCDASNPCNFLITTGYSTAGTYFGGYSTGARFNHGHVIAAYETLYANAPYGKATSVRKGNEYSRSCSYTPILKISSYDSALNRKVLACRLPYIFQYTDLVAGIGYNRSLFLEFTTEDVLLNRAEAYILTGQYDKALADMNMWAGNTFSTYTTMTEESINAWADGMEYYTPTEPTPKKAFNTHYNIADKTMENFCHAILMIRRFEQIHMGQRWFDVKRYGIEIYRRQLDEADYNIEYITDVLPARDERRALQIPYEVRQAGLKKNPRKTDTK